MVLQFALVLQFKIFFLSQQCREKFFDNQIFARTLLKIICIHYLYWCIIARQCVTDPPDPYFGMDVIWPGKSRDLGSTISYACPFRTGTHEAELKCKFLY